MHYRPQEKKGCHSREGGNPKPIGGKRKVQLIMFTYLELSTSLKECSPKFFIRILI